MQNETLNWKWCQVFGEEGSVDNVSEDDIISAMAFDPSGNYIALGDKAGRLIVFEKNDLMGKDAGGKSKAGEEPQLEYQYATELQSHTREFDCLK